MPNVSVIIPTHNRAELLRSAITSVLNQTYQDFEIIVVDDASKDNTHEVVANFGDRRIRYIHHETGKGDAGARNTGIIHSTGGYIGFLDDDDQWLPKKLGLQVAMLENSPQHVGCVYTGQFDVDGTDGRILSIYYPNQRGDLSKHLFADACIVTSTVLLKREVFEKVGLFDESIPYCNDYDMWIRIAKEFHFDYIREPLTKYLVHTNKLSGNFDLSIKGREIILEKYRSDFNLNRKAYGYAYRVLGELYCYNGNVKKGKEAFLQSIKIYPLEVRSYCHYCLSLLGANNFKFTRGLARQLLAPLRARKVRSKLQNFAVETSRHCG
jgi:glycosyltransferase involved in cell wall biosynthesis